MRKVNRQVEAWRRRRYLKAQKQQFIAARAKRRNKRKRGKLRREHAKYYERLAGRQRVVKQVYKKQLYDGLVSEVKISGELGIEGSSGLQKYLDAASRIIGFEGGGLNLDINDCTRVWPSAIMLLCSLGQWIELTAIGKKRGLISSTSPRNTRVAGYLSQCGFYDYVGRMRDIGTPHYDLAPLVRIERERDRVGIDIRSQELEDFLQNHCFADGNDFEKFNCIVLSEIFNNITEHGKAHRDRGYWLMAQVHPKHGFASVCLADNGIGFGNSLRTGWQSDTLRDRMGSKIKEDGRCLKIALEPDVSGSLKAPPPKKLVLKKSRFDRGARKGNGLKRLTDCCKELGIQLSILSHNGYIILNGDGVIIQNGTTEKRIFAGTMYNLLVKTKTGKS